MKKYTKAFSFVELIMSLWVIIILWVIASTWYSSMQEKSNNSKTISDLRTINNALTTYKDEKKSLPLPSWNLSFYKDDTSYAHSYDESFWVSWFITSDTIDKKYLSFSPIDSKTNQYYGYGKTYFMLNMIENAIKQKKRVLLFSLEMTAEEIISRLMKLIL